jgi:hypothetical protein
VFGILKKKQAHGQRIDERSHEILARAAAMLEMQLMLCRSQPGYEQRLGKDYVRGYLVGFFDAAIQHASLPAHNEQDFFLLIAAGHTYLFSGNANIGGSFALESLSRQGRAEFDAAQGQAGDEYFAFLEGKIRHPIELQRYFFSGAANA